MQSLKEMSAVQLVGKKDAIEAEIKEFNDVLQTVSCDGLVWTRCGDVVGSSLPNPMLVCSKVELAYMALWWTEMGSPGVTSMCMLCALLETGSYVSELDLPEATFPVDEGETASSEMDGPLILTS